MLLQSNFISGMEYTQYLTLRLGIPVSAKIRKELEETRKALSNEFMNLDTDDELVSFEDVGRGL